MGQQHLGLPGSLHTVGLWSRWEQHLCWPWGHSQQPRYLLQVSSALLYSLYFLRSILCVSYRYAYLCSTCLSGALEGQKKLMDLLELELQMIVSCYVGAGN